MDNQFKQWYYKNNKTGDLYYAIKLAKNCTNENDGQIMVIYYKCKTELEFFVREYSEFMEKFTMERDLQIYEKNSSYGK